MKDPLLGNKIAGALLFALLLFFGLPQLADRLFGGHGAHHGDVALAYPIAFETGPAGGGEAAVEADLGTLLANANPQAGERRAALCKSCHTFEKGGANSTGPNLWGAVGRPVASHEGFNYTSALKAFGGEWTYERLDGFIANSQAYVPGTAMVQRFAKPEQRAEILAYLQTLSDNPVPFPEPAPAPQAAGENEGASEPATTEADTATSQGGDAGQPTENPVDTADDAGEQTPPDEDASDPNPDH